MSNQINNLFIVENNAEISSNIHKFIEEKFGTMFTIKSFFNATETIRKIDENTKIIILDYDYSGDTGNKIINFVRNINPRTKVIIRSNTIEIGEAIEKYRNKEKNNLNKNQPKKNLLSPKVSRIVHYPAYHLDQKYGVRPFIF